MRIGLVCPYNIFKGGGVQECVLALQNEYQKQGHTAVIITPRPKGVTEPSTASLQLVGAATDVKSPFATTAQVSVSVDGKELDELLQAQKFDVLHFHEPWVPMLSRQILAKSSSVNIATFHAKLPETIMSKTIERVITPYTRSILKYFTTFTAVSDAAASYVRTLTKHSIEIVPNGIDLTKYVCEADKSSKTILYVGRLEKRKGVVYLLAAYKDVKQRLPGAKLVIVGDGPDKSKLQAYVRQHKITDVEFAGHVDEAVKLKLFSQAGVFCSPALYGESFGIVLLEAIACGVPVVAGNNPGYSSVLTGKGSLSLVDPKNTNVFARRIELFLTDNEVRAMWRTWAKQTINDYNYDKIANRYIKVYKQAIRLKKIEARK